MPFSAPVTITGAAALSPSAPGKKYFGDGTWTIYDGTHFMEYEYILSFLIPKIYEVLGISGE